MLANKLRISPLVGYLLAGVWQDHSLRALLPIPSLRRNWLTGRHSVDVWRGSALFAEGFVAVKAIAIPGAIAQIAVATLWVWRSPPCWAGR